MPFLSKCFSILSCYPHKVRCLLQGPTQPSYEKLCLKYSWFYWLLKDVTFAKLSTRLSSAASNRNRASCQKCQHHTAVDVYCTLTKIFLFLVLALSSIEIENTIDEAKTYDLFIIRDLETQQTLCRFQVLGVTSCSQALLRSAVRWKTKLKYFEKEKISRMTMKIQRIHEKWEFILIFRSVVFSLKRNYALDWL